MSTVSSRQVLAGLRLLVLASALQISAPIGMGQENADQARGLWNKAFEAARPAARKRPKRPRNEQGTIANRLIGLTIWRLRNSGGKTAENPRSLEHKPETGRSPFVTERVKADTLFNEGDLIRIGIEVPHEGFLYVVDREVYANRTLGDPFLIFPTIDLRGGDNRVYPGRVIEIPAPSDQPPYFTLKRSRQDHVSDKLTIIVSPFRLAIESRYQGGRLDTSQITKWENLWSSVVEQREATSGTGAQRTSAEDEAGQRKRLLARGDPLPQTMFRVGSKAGQVLLITVPLRIAP